MKKKNTASGKNRTQGRTYNPNVLTIVANSSSIDYTLNWVISLVLYGWATFA